MPHEDPEIAAAEALVASLAPAIKQDLLDPDGEAMRELGAWFVGVLLGNKRVDVREQDSGYDVSTYGVRTNEAFDLSKYQTVGEFLHNEATGNTYATYVSGHGLAAQVYWQQAAGVCDEIFDNLIKAKYSQLLNSEGCLDDPYLDELNIQQCGAMVLLDAFEGLKLMDCYTRYLADALRVRHEESVRARVRAEARAQYRQFLVDLAGELPTVIEGAAGPTRYEKSNWGVLLDILKDLADQHGVERVGAALQLCRLDLSGSVSAELGNRYPAPPGS